MVTNPSPLMKYPALICLASLLFVTIAKAEQAISYPAKSPLIDIAFPDDWAVKNKSGVVYGHPEGDASFFLSISEMEATSENLSTAATEVKAGVEELFKNVVYQEPQLTEAGPLHIMLINAKGEDEDGKANINLWMIAQKDVPEVVLIKCISSQEAFEKHGLKALDIIKGLTAHQK